MAAAVAAALLAACAAPIARAPTGEARAPAGFPEAYYSTLMQRGGDVFAVDAASSLVVIEVRRAGSLAKLGHDHVVASRAVHGYVAPNAGRADLYVRLDELVVDDPALRIRAALDTQPSEEAIAGTRENMLGKINAELHPYALISVASVTTEAAGVGLNTSITLNGVTREQRVLATLALTGDGLAVDGRTSVEQTAFGITPYSILGGALTVQDRVDIRFEIRARRVANSSVL